MPSPLLRTPGQSNLDAARGHRGRPGETHRRRCRASGRNRRRRMTPSFPFPFPRSQTPSRTRSFGPSSLKTGRAGQPPAWKVRFLRRVVALPTQSRTLTSAPASEQGALRGSVRRGMKAGPALCHRRDVGPSGSPSRRKGRSGQSAGRAQSARGGGADRERSGYRVVFGIGVQRDADRDLDPGRRQFQGDHGQP